MPFKKKSKTIAKRKYGYKKPKKNAVNLVGGRNGPRTGIASRVVTCLKYHQRLNLSLTGAVANDYIFRLNSLFDPDYTSAGHQPMYFDQLAAIYNKYKVFKTSWVIKMIVSSDTTGSVETTIVPNNNLASLAAAGADTIAEMPRAFYKQWNSNTPITMRGSCNLPKLTGRTSAQYKSDDLYGANVGTNPSEELALHLINISSSTLTVTFDAQLKFHCEFYDPNNVSGS